MRASFFEPPQTDRTVSERVLAAIEARTGRDPLEYDQRLFDVIDPDALDALFQSDDAIGQVTFTYVDYEVTVDSDGDVAIAPVGE